MENIIFFGIGFFISLFTVLPVFIILFFGIPMAKKLESQGFLKKDHKIVKNYSMSLILLPSLYIGIAFAINKFYPTGFAPFLFGVIPTLLLGLPKIGKNIDNISDFIDTNHDEFTQKREDIIKAITLA